MKQNITVQQLNELSEKAIERLKEWNKNSEPYYMTTDGIKHELSFLPIMSIGQMIEYLDEVEAEGNDYIDVSYGDGHTWRDIGPIMLWNDTNKENLCDELWKAVREVLES